MMQFFDAETTRRHLGAAKLIEALRQMFREGCEVPLRHTHSVGEGTLLLMPAWRAGQRLGIKTVTIFPGHSARGQPGLHSTYLPFDAATGVPLAQLDGDQTTSRRTAAASALAASFLARADASRSLIVGSGSFTPAMCEADATCFQRSPVCVDTLEALAKSGDVLSAVEAEAFQPDQLAGTLAELCRGTRPGRSSAAQITLFKAVGSALEDLAAAELVFDGVQADSLSLAPATLCDRAP